MKIISYNVNGIRAAMRKGFLEWLQQADPDVICIQETKANKEQVEINLLEKIGYHNYWFSAQKKGYSGTAVFSKIKPIDAEIGLDIPKHNTEGRVITLEFDQYFLVTVYTPNAKRDLSRLPYRYKEWDPDFLAYVKSLDKTKPVVFCGDLNVAHTELDLANPKSNKSTKTKPGNAGFTDEEREGFDNIVNAGFIDTFREFTDGNGHYSWWSYMAKSRSRNIGWRIDYFMISPQLRPNLVSAKIRPEIMGSDHCPVEIELEF